MQTWEWGEFREKAGNKVVRLGVFDGYKLTDAVQVIFSKIPHTNYKIGTVIKGQKPTVEIIKELKKRLVDSRPFFWPISMFPMYKEQNTPIAHHLAFDGMNLPSGLNLTKKEVDYVCFAIRDILKV